MNFDNIYELLSVCVAFASVCVSLYAVWQAKKSVLTGEYFSEMTEAYAAFLTCIAEFVFSRSKEDLHKLSSSLHRLLLFSSDEIGQEAQVLYLHVIDWAESGQLRARSVDNLANELGDLMKSDLEHFRKKGHH